MAKKKAKKTHAPVRWFLRALRSATHSNLGKSLASADTSDISRLNEKTTTVDGEHDLWECTDMRIDNIKALVLDFLEKDKVVYVYRKVGRDQPTRWEDDDLKKSMASLLERVVNKSKKLEDQAPSPHLAAAQERLNELTSKK